MLREALSAAPGSSPLPPAAEAALVLRAVRATKLPTLTADDLARFAELMRDAWPSVAVDEGGSAALSAALHAAWEARGLQAAPEQARRRA